MSSGGTQTFAMGVSNAIAIVKHLWTQINALQDAVTEQLPDALKGFGLHVAECDDEYEEDEQESVCIAGMWSYELKRSGRQDGGGRKKTIGRIYMWVRLAPTVGAEANGFVPFIAVDVANEELNDKLDIADLGDTSDNLVGVDGCSLIPEGLRFTEQDIAGFEWRDEDGHYGAAAYLPLNAVNSENVQSVLIQKTKELVRYCLEQWKVSSSLLRNSSTAILS